MKSNSAQVSIPSFNAMVSKEITRDKGSLAIEARTNVEIEEVTCASIAVTDVSEVGLHLTSTSSRYIVDTNI